MYKLRTLKVSFPSKYVWLRENFPIDHCAPLQIDHDSRFPCQNVTWLFTLNTAPLWHHRMLGNPQCKGFYTGVAFCDAIAA